MIIYEVNLEIDEDVNFKFAGWLPGHMQKMIELRGFGPAYWFFRNPEDEQKDKGKVYWTVHYVVDDRACLDDYLNNHAQRFRQEALDLFGNSFKSDRRILNLLSVAGMDLGSPQMQG